MVVLGDASVALGVFGQKLCTFYTIFSIIRIYMKQKRLTCFRKLSICMEKQSAKGYGVLVTALIGLELSKDI